MKSGCHGRSRTCSSLFQRQLSVPIQSAWQWCKDAESNRLSLRHEFYRLAPFPHGRPCKKIGGTEGNRTLISCLQGRHSPVELRSRGCGDRIRTCCLQLMRLARSLMPLPRVEVLVDGPGYAPGSPALQTGALTRSAIRPRWLPEQESNPPLRVQSAASYR